MRVLGAVVEVKGAHLLAPKRAARDHPLDRLFKHALREAALEHLARGEMPPGAERVTRADLLAELADEEGASETDGQERA